MINIQSPINSTSSIHNQCQQHELSREVATGLAFLITFRTSRESRNCIGRCQGWSADVSTMLTTDACTYNTYLHLLLIDCPPPPQQKYQREETQEKGQQRRRSPHHRTVLVISSLLLLPFGYGRMFFWYSALSPDSSDWAVNRHVQYKSSMSHINL